ncbi:MAG: VacJ family lipoprotein [Magnetococcales bacterium]|nr:VacJ family lipoprotein [Magnetococcales bacterium]
MRVFFGFILVLALFWMPVDTLAESHQVGGEIHLSDSEPISDDDLWGPEEVGMEVSDPLEPWNRLMFAVNDIFYHALLKPVSQLYGFIIPEFGRVGIRNAFHNLTMPQHFLNALLQGKGTLAARELGRFGINSTLGILGLMDIAESRFGMPSGDEDFGQTMGAWGIGDSLYLVWPLIGPSNLRDSVGLVGDAAVNPFTYVPEDSHARAGIFALKVVNNTSLRIGEYEALKESAIDPYVSLRDAYLQLRRRQITE